MTFDLEYNSEREHLLIPEYGRHLQKLVNHCIAIEDDEERNKMARAIVDVMGNLQPHLRDVPDFKHKLWDQLFIISDFKLKAESPYPQPSKEELQEKPEPLPYPKTASKYRFYGNNIQTMIDVALSWEEGDKTANMRIAFGGMAAIPKRALATENVLRDNIVTEALLDKACQALNEDFTPLSDMRASSSYRQQIAQNLLRKAFAAVPVSLAKVDS